MWCLHSAWHASQGIVTGLPAARCFAAWRWCTNNWASCSFQGAAGCRRDSHNTLLQHASKHASPDFSFQHPRGLQVKGELRSMGTHRERSSSSWQTSPCTVSRTRSMHPGCNQAARCSQFGVSEHCCVPKRFQTLQFILSAAHSRRLTQSEVLQNPGWRDRPEILREYTQEASLHVHRLLKRSLVGCKCRSAWARSART